MFQLLKNKLASNLGIDYETLESDAKSSGSGTHVYTINKFIELFKDRNRMEARNLSNKIKDLKAFRLESDYFNLQIDSMKGSSALRVSGEIIQTIKRNF